MPSDIAATPPHAAHGEPASERNVVPLVREPGQAENATSDLPASVVSLAIDILAIAHGGSTYQERRDLIANALWNACLRSYRQGFRYGAGIEDAGMFQFPPGGRS